MKEFYKELFGWEALKYRFWNFFLFLLPLSAFYIAALPTGHLLGQYGLYGLREITKEGGLIVKLVMFSLQALIPSLLLTFFINMALRNHPDVKLPIFGHTILYTLWAIIGLIALYGGIIGF